MLPGDALLYGPKGLYGWVIRFHTGHPIAHVEVYAGDGRTVASRNGKGVGLYDFNPDRLKGIYRPTQPFDFDAAMRWFGQLPPMRYGWADLLNFIDVDVDADGIVCSPFATLFYRAGGFNPFGDEPANKVAPFMFEATSCMRKVVEDGQVTRIGV